MATFFIKNVTFHGKIRVKVQLLSVAILQEKPQANGKLQSSVDVDSLHVRRKKLYVTLLEIEWCSAKCGLSTINRVLA